MNSYIILLFMAIFPVIVLCNYIYKKDTNKEPIHLLILIFVLGFIMALPVIYIELVLDGVFPTENVKDFYQLFINIFFSIALVEEGAKWIITQKVGYSNKEFDEIYDIIIYSVFASLGFACIENIFYVLSNGLFVAIVRGFLSVPGHMCFGVLMGYFLAKAKVSSIHRNQKLYYKNIFLSIVIPSLVHTLYDTLLYYSSVEHPLTMLAIFLVLFIILFIICFKIVNYVSNIQRKLYIRNTLTNSDHTKCPICGYHVGKYNYCGNCGYKMK